MHSGVTVLFISAPPCMHIYSHKIFLLSFPLHKGTKVFYNYKNKIKTRIHFIALHFPFYIANTTTTKKEKQDDYD